MSEFQNPLSPADYLGVDVFVDGVDVTAPQGTVTPQSLGFAVKELVCAILAGNGIKLPNVQICLRASLEGILNALDTALEPLRAAIGAALDALNKFIEHTGIAALLARLNDAIAEIATIANMINFCGTPVQPRSISDVLADMCGSYTGAGMDALNGLGTIIPGQVGGCLNVGRSITGVNCDMFSGGAIKDLCDLTRDIQEGTVSNIPARIASIDIQFRTFESAINDLIEKETNPVTTENKGGSTFVPPSDPSRINDKVGAGLEPNMSMAESLKLATDLQSAYNQLSKYPVDSQGNNIFDLILEPELIAKLSANTFPTQPIAEQQPVYDYCGRIIGYTESSVVSDPNPTSTGGPVTLNTQPGAPGPEVTPDPVDEFNQQLADINDKLADLQSSVGTTTNNTTTIISGDGDCGCVCCSGLIDILGQMTKSIASLQDQINTIRTSNS